MSATATKNGTTAETLHLHRLEVENFMRVEALTVNADGHHVMIEGPNASGKTSTVEAIWSALRGASSKDTPEPVRAGAKKASIKLDLGEYVVERRWTEKSTTLIVTAKDGNRVMKPQALLDGLLGKYSLDPVAFLEQRPQDQVSDILAICGIEPPVEAVREAAGEDRPTIPGESAESYLLRLAGEGSGEYYLLRREAGRVVDAKRAALNEQRDTLARLGGAPDGEPESVASMLTDMQALEAKAEERRGLIDASNEASSLLSEASTRLLGIKAEAAQVSNTIGSIEQQIEALQKQLAEANESKRKLNERIVLGQEVCGYLRKDLDAADAARDAFPDPATEIRALRDRMAGVEAANAANAKRRQAAEHAERLAKELKDAEQQHDRLDSIVEALRSIRANLLNGIDLGVPGLEVGHGELRLDGVTFKQASQAQQIRVACAVAMRQKPRLRLLRIDEGERLDRNSREIVLRLAKENDWQVVMTAVRDLDALKVEIVDA